MFLLENKELIPPINNQDEWVLKIAADSTDTELCGLYLPTPHNGSRVINLTNYSSSPENSFVSYAFERREKLEGWWEKASQEELNQVVLWHTHPRGLIGPSKGDLDARPTQQLFQLVITPIQDQFPVIMFY